MLLDRKGKGRVALLTSDQAWLWARRFDGGGPHTQLLRRLSHWLMKEPDLEEERLRASAKGLNITIERRSMEDKVPGLTVSEPGGKSSDLTLSEAGTGRWQATMKATQAGLYKFQTKSPTGTLTAVAHAGIADPREMSEVTATDKKLRPVIEETGGNVYLDPDAQPARIKRPNRCFGAAGDDADGGASAVGLELDGPARPRSLRDARGPPDADVHRPCGACRPAVPDHVRLVARRTLGDP